MSSFQGVGIEEFHCIQRCPHFRGSSTVYRDVLVSEGWNRGVPLYTEMSSFQRVGIEGSRDVLISEGWNRVVPLYTEMSSFQGIGIEGLHCIQRCPHFRRLDSTVYRGILISEGASMQGFHCIQRYPHFRGGFHYIQRCPHFGVLE